MDNIVYFTPKQDKEEWLNRIYEILKQADKALLVIQIGDETKTAYLNCTPIEKFELVTNMQYDIFREMIKEEEQ